MSLVINFPSQGGCKFFAAKIFSQEKDICVSMLNNFTMEFKLFQQCKLYLKNDAVLLLISSL